MQILLAIVTRDYRLTSQVSTCRSMAIRSRILTLTLWPIVSNFTRRRRRKNLVDRVSVTLLTSYTTFFVRVFVNARQSHAPRPVSAAAAAASAVLRHVGSHAVVVMVVLMLVVLVTVVCDGRQRLVHGLCGAAEEAADGRDGGRGGAVAEALLDEPVADFPREDARIFASVLFDALFDLGRGDLGLASADDARPNASRFLHVDAKEVSSLSSCRAVTHSLSFRRVHVATATRE